ASGGDDGAIRIWDAGTGRQHNFISLDTVVQSLAFSNDGRTLVSGGADGSVKIWDVASGSQRRPTFKGHSRSVEAGAFTRDDTGIVSLGLEQEPKEQLNVVKLWDSNSGQELARFKHPRDVASMAIAPDRKMLATGGMDRVVRYWDLTTNKEQKQL